MFYGAIKIAWIPATWCPYSRAAKPAKCDVTRFAQTNTADNITRPWSAGANTALPVALISSAVKIQIIPREYLVRLQTVWRHKKLISPQSPWPYFCRKKAMFQSRQIYKRLMFATWYTASCNLQRLYRTAGTKNNSIHLHFKRLGECTFWNWVDGLTPIKTANHK